MKLASLDESRNRPPILPPMLPVSSNGTGFAPGSVKNLTEKSKQLHLAHFREEQLTREEAVAALMANCARVRIVDSRNGRWMELQGDASLVPHLQGLAIGPSRNGSLKPIMNQQAKSREVLNSWKEISRYLNRGVRTVQRYQATLGLPVRRTSGKSRSAVLAFTDELDAWLQARPMQASNPAAERQQ